MNSPYATWRVFKLNICWDNGESYVLSNPSYTVFDRQRFNRILEYAHRWPAHIWLSTSGSSVQKWVGLSKQAILTSAQAVNIHLKSNSEDCWVKALPSFHVGGLGIEARAYLSGAMVFDVKGKWQAKEFYTAIKQVKGTLSALVPTQLHDLVMLGLTAPPSLRALVIGGGPLPPILYEQAIALGWPLLPSYGLTECASQVATAPLESWKGNQFPPLQLLSHIQACEHDERLYFAGPSLLSAYAYFEGENVQFLDPKVEWEDKERPPTGSGGLKERWFMSGDRGTIQNGQVTIVGRTDSIVKIGGENVDVARLDNHLQTLRLNMGIQEEVILLSVPDERLGCRLLCASTSKSEENLTLLIEQFQQTVLPFERIRQISLFPEFPRSSLGKILKNELMIPLIKSGIKQEGKSSF